MAKVILDRDNWECAINRIEHVRECIQDERISTQLILQFLQDVIDMLEVSPGDLGDPE